MLPNSALHARISATASHSAEQYLFASCFVGRPRTTHLRKLTARDVQWLPALADLLIDGVHHGASLGFLAPLSRYQALDYWQGVFAHLGTRQSLWIAGDFGNSGDEQTAHPLQGAVQLSLCPRANARHRGEVQRLMVHSQSRSRGIAVRPGADENSAVGIAPVNQQKATADVARPVGPVAFERAVQPCWAQPCVIGDQHHHHARRASVAANPCERIWRNPVPGTARLAHLPLSFLSRSSNHASAVAKRARRAAIKARASAIAAWVFALGTFSASGKAWSATTRRKTSEQRLTPSRPSRPKPRWPVLWCRCPSGRAPFGLSSGHLLEKSQFFMERRSSGEVRAQTPS